eukprot:16438496-Heterocapsa_arctica.AAC.1
MVSGGLAIAAATEVDRDTQLFSHYPVQLNKGGKLSEYLGVIIRRPSACVGITNKEAKKSIIPEGDFITKDGTIFKQKIRWNQEADAYLCHQEDKRGKEFKGRGQPVVYIKNTIAPPQDNTEGFAINEEMREAQLKLNRMRKYQNVG